MLKRNHILFLKIINILFFYNQSIIGVDIKDISDIQKKYFIDNNTNKKTTFGFVNNKQRFSIDARGKEEYDIKGKKKKRGISNVSFSTKKINNLENKIIKEDSSLDTSKNYLDIEMTDEEYNDFISELFKDFEDEDEKNYNI